MGGSWLRKAQRMVGRAMDARPRLGEDRFVDIRYKDLIKDPVAAARVIQERAGLTFDEATEQRMRRTLEQEKKDRHGVHRYGLELFGLTPGDVNGALGRSPQRRTGSETSCSGPWSCRPARATLWALGGRS
ncbi:MAG: sulfotransferase [Polyangiaceae bacterium]|nr:sulfotransferase [Polyangiaceae bacterium]